MVTFDLHYHANIDFSSKTAINECLRKQHKCLMKTNIDYIASTEHVYKKPLETFLYFSDITNDLHTTIIPGVEWISKEGIDIIFLFDSENSFRYALKYLKPFSASIWDIQKLQKETNSITIIPHPFTPGRTGAAIILGEEMFIRLLKKVDYVEIHNGLCLIFMGFKFLQRKPFVLTSKMKQILYTFDLPLQFKLDHLGWSIGSDSHFPGEQRIVGSFDAVNKCESWFALLSERVHFIPFNIPNSLCSETNKLKQIIMNGKSVINEAVIKYVLRNKWAK